jgi:hypothetical protein
MKLTIPLSTFLHAEKASVRLCNTLASYQIQLDHKLRHGSKAAPMTLSQFIDAWPLERLRKEVYGFSPQAQAELHDILERRMNFNDARLNKLNRYVVSLAPPPTLEGKQLVAVLRRQKTCLEKRVRQMERDQAQVKRGLHVIKWAARAMGLDISSGGYYHALDQLRRAVKKHQAGGSR